MDKKCEFDDICNWKDPKKTIYFLIYLNLSHLFYLYFKPSLISLIVQSIFYHTLIATLCEKFNVKLPNIFCHKICNEEQDIQKEAEKCYINTYDNVNKILNKLRDMILLNDLKIIYLILSCIIIITFFSHLTSVTVIILAINLYFLITYLKKNEKLTQKLEKSVENIKNIIENKIPKYKKD
jgi:hypothetical protein